MCFAAGTLSCGHAALGGGGSHEVQVGHKGKGERRVREAELQEDLQRFTGQFMDRIAQAMDEVLATDANDAAADQALRLGLLYGTSALDIAAEPLPALGVVDMMVFLRLNHQVLLEHWVPNGLGERGQSFVQAFERAEEQLSPIADKILDSAQQKTIYALVDDWRRANPKMFRVEAVRLTDFSKYAGAEATARAEELGGVLASVKAATQTADQALLLGERAMFLATRMPFLLRLQVRVAGRDEMRDAKVLVTSTESLAKSVGELAPMVKQLPALVTATTDAARATDRLVKDVQPLVPTPEQVHRVEHTLETANDLVTNSTSLVSDLRATTAEGPEGPIARIAKRVDATMARALGYLVALGAAWSLMWWGGYVLAKRSARDRTLPRAPVHG
jgi:hypothetical protein